MGPPLRIIVVDDDSKVRLLLERAFRAPEFETHTFPTGAAALGRIAEIRPDCVVSDLLMPEMDGESLVRALRAVPGLERVPFIALSAVRSETRIRAVLAAGADAFLLKPIPLRELVEKVRALLEWRKEAQPTPQDAGGQTSSTQPVVSAPQTRSTAAVRPELPDARGGLSPPPSGTMPPALLAVPPTLSSPAAARAAVTAAPRPDPLAEDGKLRLIEIGPLDPTVGFGRFTRVIVRGRSLLVLTEAVAEPRFTVTTVVTEKGVPLRKVDSALAHPLARDDDRDVIRREVDLQHEDVLRRLDELVVASSRRVLWTDRSRSVDAGILALAVSAVALLTEARAGADETSRQLRLTRERALAGDHALRVFHVTRSARVVVDPQGARVARRTVRAVAAWCCAFAIATLQADADGITEPVRQATRSHAFELGRMGFYERLQRRA
jgi:CheY-like chemotaxis protein